MTIPISKIKISTSKTHLPGYCIIPVDLNFGTRSRVINMTGFIPKHPYLNYKRDNANPITDVRVLEGRHKPAPENWEKDATDLNAGMGGKYLYLTWTRGSGLPVMDLIVQVSNTPNQQAPVILDEPYQRIPVDLNAGAGNQFIYLYTLKKEPDDVPNLTKDGIPADWVINMKKEYEISRAQISHNRMLVHRLRLVLVCDDILAPNEPYKEKVSYKEGVDEDSKKSLSQELTINLEASYSNWGASISGKLGYKLTTNASYELSTKKESIVEREISIPAVDHARRLVVCTVQDVLSIYAIPTGDLVACAVNGTPYHGKFVQDTKNGPFKSIGEK